MKKIKVYLQYPWKIPDSLYYKSLVKIPPKNVKFIETKQQEKIITNKNFFWTLNFIKRNMRRFLNVLGLSIPNVHLSPIGDYDIIHCAHCLSKNRDKPWVADIEMNGSFAISGENTKKCQRKIQAILSNKNCKRILPWTESVKEKILKIYPEIKDKLDVVYPAIPEIKNLKKPKNKNLKIIFVSRYFDIKGGVIALEVLERLRKKYRTEGIVISSVPENLKKKYYKLKIYPLMPQKVLYKFMESSDIYLYPSQVDTFGFSLLESMAFGLPIVTINTKSTESRREIVENNKTGFIFDVNPLFSLKKIGEYEEQIINKLIENASKLIENKRLREKMSKEGIKTIKSGKFSIEERNKKLKRIYEESIR